MIFQVNYKYVTPQNKLRTSQIVIEAKDANEARSTAMKELKEEVETGHFMLMKIAPFIDTVK